MDGVLEIGAVGILTLLTGLGLGRLWIRSTKPEVPAEPPVEPVIRAAVGMVVSGRDRRLVEALREAQQKALEDMLAAGVSVYDADAIKEGLRQARERVKEQLG